MHLLLVYKHWCTASLLLYQNSKSQERISIHSEKSLPGEKKKKKGIKILYYYKPDLKTQTKQKSFSQDHLYSLFHCCAVHILVLFYHTGYILQKIRC